MLSKHSEKYPFDIRRNSNIQVLLKVFLKLAEIRGACQRSKAQQLSGLFGSQTRAKKGCECKFPKGALVAGEGLEPPTPGL